MPPVPLLLAASPYCTPQAVLHDMATLMHSSLPSRPHSHRFLVWFSGTRPQTRNTAMRHHARLPLLFTAWFLEGVPRWVGEPSLGVPEPEFCPQILLLPSPCITLLRHHMQLTSSAQCGPLAPQKAGCVLPFCSLLSAPSARSEGTNPGNDLSGTAQPQPLMVKRRGGGPQRAPSHTGAHTGVTGVTTYFSPPLSYQDLWNKYITLSYVAIEILFSCMWKSNAQTSQLRGCSEQTND